MPWRNSSMKFNLRYIIDNLVSIFQHWRHRSCSSVGWQQVSCTANFPHSPTGSMSGLLPGILIMKQVLTWPLTCQVDDTSLVSSVWRHQRIVEGISNRPLVRHPNQFPNRSPHTGTNKCLCACWTSHSCLCDCLQLTFMWLFVVQFSFLFLFISLCLCITSEYVVCMSISESVLHAKTLTEVRHSFVPKFLITVFTCYSTFTPWSPIFSFKPLFSHSIPSNSSCFSSSPFP